MDDVLKRYIDDPEYRKWMNHLMLSTGLIKTIPEIEDVIEAHNG